MTPNFGTIYVIDCAKVEEWSRAPISGAKLVEEMLKEQDIIGANSIVFGKIEKVEREGAIVRVYVKHEKCVALGSFITKEEGEVDATAGA